MMVNLRHPFRSLNVSFEAETKFQGVDLAFRFEP